jgi:hypothetical protein
LLPTSSGREHDYHEYDVCFCKMTVPNYQTTRRQNPEYHNFVISRNNKGDNKRGSKRINKMAKQNGDEILCVELREVKKDGSVDARDAHFGVCFAKIRSTVEYTAPRNVKSAANHNRSTFSAQHVYRHVILYWEELTKSCVSGGTNRTFPLHCSLIIITSSATHSELPNSSLDKTHAYTG